MRKSIAVILMFTIFSGLFVACLSNKQDPFQRTVTTSEPLNEPVYGGALVEPFSKADPMKYLSKMNVFIFKGRIDNVYEIEIEYNHGTTEDVLMIKDWLSVCEVKIDNILYGSIPGINDTQSRLFQANQLEC